MQSLYRNYHRLPKCNLRRLPILVTARSANGVLLTELGIVLSEALKSQMESPDMSYSVTRQQGDIDHLWTDHGSRKITVCKVPLRP